MSWTLTLNSNSNRLSMTRYYVKSVQIAVRFATITYIYVIWQMHVSVLQDWQGHCKCNVSMLANSQILPGSWD